MDYLKRTWAEVHLDRLKYNVEQYKKLISKENELLCVVKASCYGHGDKEICTYLEQELDVKWFAVSNITEALRLREYGIKGEILILGFTPPDKAEELSENNIIQTLTEYSYAEKLNRYALNFNKKVRCHMAIDTGMTRIGLRGKTENIADELIKTASLENIELEGMFTHFAVADNDNESDKKYTKEQIQKFFDVKTAAENAGLKLEYTHCLNSAGGIYHNDNRSTLARLGIIMYGLMPNPENPLPFKPKPVMDLKSVVSQVKTVEAGIDISYGRTYKTDKKRKIATVTCGYADGYPRALSNKGEVLIHGKRAKITGRVCMDQFMCDVTDIPDVKMLDEVTLIGKDGNEVITADDIATLTNTIGYEIVCNITSRVPRIFF